MKKVLSLLLAFVFLHVQSWALSGGPFGSQGRNSISGTYAGVFTGVSGTLTNPTTGATTMATGTNSIGIFVMGVPTTNLASGTVALFVEGFFYQGGILGIADPDKQMIYGVSQAIHLSDIFTDNVFGNSIQFDSRADGAFKAEVNQTTGRIQGTGSFGVQVLDPTGVGGGFFFGGSSFVNAGKLSFVVEGWLQSGEVISPDKTSLASLLNNGGTN